MNSMQLPLSILLALATYGLAQVSNKNYNIFNNPLNDEYCCDVTPYCTNVSTLNINIQQFAETSPHYELILSKDEYSSTYQSVCTTYFKVTDSLYLEFRSITVAGGKTELSLEVVTNLAPGVFRLQGVDNVEGNTTSVHNAYVVGTACPNSCSPIYVYYKCYLFDSCQYVNAKIDYNVNGKSTSPTSTAKCLNAVKKIIRNQGLKVLGFVEPPSDSFSCVAYFGNSTCVNYQEIAPANRISYPQNSCN